MKFVIFLFLTAFSCPVWALSFDWSGWTRVESYYQNSDSHNYYGSYHFVLQPKIHVIDGLSVTSRLDLSPMTASPVSSYENDYRQTGFVFAYGENSTQREIEFPHLFLKISQIYLDYESEFFKIRLGRAPYHFGMGTSYSASQNPFHHWMTVYNQVALFMEYTPFYVQPMLIHKDTGAIAGSAQAGLSRESWKASALYQYDFENSSFIEVFGEYDQKTWGLKGSFANDLKDLANMTTALSAFIKISAKIPFQLEIKTGGALGELSFHPNYNVALLYGNRFIKNSSSPEVSAEQENSKGNTAEPFQIAQGQIQNGIYFSPRVLLSFLDDSLRIRPIGLLARDLDEKKYYYEFNLEGSYQLDESLYLSVTGGALYEEALHFALLAQAAVSF